MKEIDYSWDDQNYEQMQLWHETLGKEISAIDDIENFPPKLSIDSLDEGIDSEELSTRSVEFRDWVVKIFGAEAYEFLMDSVKMDLEDALARKEFSETWGLADAEIEAQVKEAFAAVRRHAEITGSKWRFIRFRY